MIRNQKTDELHSEWHGKKGHECSAAFPDR